MLSNKIVVVTGGAGVLGQSFVHAIIENGGTAVMADLDFDAAKQIAGEMERERPGKIEAIQMDITNKDSICNVISDVMIRHGRIDAVINNAYPRNKQYGCKLEDVTYLDFCDNLNMHLGGYFLVLQQFCRVFKEQGKGNVINMSSIYGTVTPRFDIYQGTPMTMPVEYAAVKSAVNQLTRYFAQYFKGTGIRINSLSPGGILAGQPSNFLSAYNRYCTSKGMLDANDINGALLFLLSDMSEFINGQNIIIDDGFSL